MNSKWQKVQFKDLLAENTRNGLTKPKKIRGQGVNMISMKEIFANNRINDIDMEKVPVTNEEMRKFDIRKNDLLFARQSLVLEGAGKCCIINEITEPTVFESHLIRVRIDIQKANPHFIYYYFNSKIGKLHMQSIVEQVAAAGIRASDLINLYVPYPNVEIQNKISYILKSIDDKIELNNQINKNLEQQAQAIFKNITDSNIAEEPLYKFIKIKHGYAFKGNFIQTIDNGVVLVTPGNFKLGGGFQENKCKFFNGEYPNDYILNSGDLIVTMTDLSKDGDTLGYGALIPYDSQRIYLHNQRIGLVKIYDNRLSKDYIYWYLRSYDYHNKIVGSASGTTVKHTSPTRILEQNIPIPNKNCEYKIKSLSNIDFMISRNDVENIYLKQIRDLLIPKLMSGEIDVYNFT